MTKNINCIQQNQIILHDQHTKFMLLNYQKSVTSPDHHSEYGGLPALSIWRGDVESSMGRIVDGVRCKFKPSARLRQKNNSLTIGKKVPPLEKGKYLDNTMCSKLLAAKIYFSLNTHDLLQ